MPTGKHRKQRLLQNLFFSDDNLAYFAKDLFDLLIHLLYHSFSYAFPSILQPISLPRAKVNRNRSQSPSCK